MIRQGLQPPLTRPDAQRPQRDSSKPIFSLLHDSQKLISRSLKVEIYPNSNENQPMKLFGSWCRVWTPDGNSFLGHIGSCLWATFGFAWQQWFTVSVAALTQPDARCAVTFGPRLTQKALALCQASAARIDFRPVSTQLPAVPNLSIRVRPRCVLPLGFSFGSNF